MRTVNISGLKARLSAHIQVVRDGEEVLVCGRNQSVARIVPCHLEDRSEQERRLVARGVLTPPLKKTVRIRIMAGAAGKCFRSSHGGSVARGTGKPLNADSGLLGFQCSGASVRAAGNYTPIYRSFCCANYCRFGDRVRVVPRVNLSTSE
jgi:antitoxin (DNA-binding transcriptional repressor) of toxin-antitoxin stability system